VAEAEYSPRAEQDLEDIWFAIAADNVTAADGVIHRIVAKVALAAEQPGIGAPRPELSQTARILIEGRYVVIYEPQADGVLVLAIIHGMREPGTWL
jgi:toxin ParE1/3/4